MLKQGEVGLDQIKSLIGTPPLMTGESEQEYWQWCSVFIDGRKPKTIPDCFEVYELAHNEWEQKRLRKCSPALVKGALVRGLGALLAWIAGLSNPDEIAKAYFDESCDGHKEARAILAKYGITKDQIVAEAMQKRGDGLFLFDRIESNRANACRSLRKDIDRWFSRNEPPEQAADGQSG
jgi:hypothetical protein